MKRVIALAALLVAASACTTTTENANLGAGNTTNVNAVTTPTPSVSQADLETQERQIWNAIKAKSWDDFAGMLADDFIIVSDSGVMNKTQTLEDLKKYDLTDFNLSDFKFVKVDDDLGVLVYTATEKSTYDGKPTPGKPARAGSAWVRRNGKWLAIYHQETEAMEPPAGQGGNMNANASTGAANANANMATANANTSASPASSPAAAPTTATDAEKAVWDTLKNKNWDAFANFLASNSLEVEPEGVFDKSGSVEGVKQTNFAHATLSDFREVKIDPDATLVTYTVKSPDKGWPPNGMRHSTIWSNRDGQWRAYFHQGTAISRGGAM